MGPHVKQLFSVPLIIRSTFSKTPNNQLSTRHFGQKGIYGNIEINIRSSKISAILNFKPPKSTFGDSKFQTPNNLTYLKFQIQNKHMSYPSSQAWISLPSPTPPPPPPAGLDYLANEPSASPLPSLGCKCQHV